MPESGWLAQYSDGIVAASHRVRARLEPDGLIIEEREGERRALWPYNEIRLIDGPDAQGQIRIGRVDSAERLAVSSPGALEQLEPCCRKMRRSISSGPGWRLVAFWSGAAILGIIVLFLGIVPFLARHAGQFVSPRLEADLGNRLADTIIRLTAAPEIDAAHAECEAPLGRAALAKLVAPLAAQVTVRNPPRVRVVNSPIINAIALPGGQILVFKGLLDFAEDPNEIAGIIAHELGHIVLDHPTTLVIERSAVGFVVGLLAGDIFGVSVVAGVSATILDASYGREAETEADLRGAMLMKGAEFDLRPVAEFFTRLSAKRADGDIPIAFLRSHPPSDERARLFQSVPSGGRRAVGNADWNALKEICGPSPVPPKK
jgi:Zn-dependent protease with chaperone function